MSESEVVKIDQKSLKVQKKDTSPENIDAF
jgi:hypothetical protein